MPITTQSLLAAIEKIKADKSLYEQKAWCGTKCCVAGHAYAIAFNFEDRRAVHASWVESALAEWEVNGAAISEVESQKRYAAVDLMHETYAKLDDIETLVKACSLDKVD